jgi:dienelactone hydrolase
MILDQDHSFEFPNGGITHRVVFDGSGPGVLLMHEINGLTPAVLRLVARITNVGFTVFVPDFFGAPNEVMPMAESVPLICIRREFQLFAGSGSSRITPWLRALAKEINRCTGGKGIGVIGLCLTGNVVLSLMVDPIVKVPVMCEPGLPFLHPSSLGAPEDDIKHAATRSDVDPLFAYRFTTDWICPAARFKTLRERFDVAKYPDRLHIWEIQQERELRLKYQIALIKCSRAIIATRKIATTRCSMFWIRY